MNVIRHVGAARNSSRGRTATRVSTFAVCFLVVGVVAPAARAEGIKWRTDYGKALKEATERGVPLMINVGSENCFWCKQLEARTLTDDEVAKILAERVVPLKIDGNKHVELVQALKVQSYPTLIFAGADGNIHGYKEGFLEAPALKEQLTKVLVAAGTPDWMQRDFDSAGRAITAKDSAKAIVLLRSVVEDGKSRPVQVKARGLLDGLEKEAAAAAAKARELADKGSTAEAIDALDRVQKGFPGTLAARKSKELHIELVSRARPRVDDSERKTRALEMMKLAREDFKSGRYLSCLDRCEAVSSKYNDVEGAGDADKLAAEIRDNPEWAKAAADQAASRMCELHLSLADTWLRKGKPEQAAHYLETIVRSFPGTKHADAAKAKLARIKGTPGEK